MSYHAGNCRVCGCDIWWTGPITRACPTLTICGPCESKEHERTHGPPLPAAPAPVTARTDQTNEWNCPCGRVHCAGEPTCEDPPTPAPSPRSDGPEVEP